MKVGYEYSKKDIKKYLLKNRWLNNLILLIIGTIIYIGLSINDVPLYFLPIFILGLMLVLFILNIIYVNIYLMVMDRINYNMYGKYSLELKGNSFTITVNNSPTTYKYNNIKYIKEHNNYFIVKMNYNREYFTFEKKYFSASDYKKILKTFKSKINY
mgnify:FL=1